MLYPPNHWLPQPHLSSFDYHRPTFLLNCPPAQSFGGDLLRIGPMGQQMTAANAQGVDDYIQAVIQ